ncbi:MAG TPA: hypothetical protein VM364_23120 [Vicinamibacterales bacterium]|nr:hypothetical protein [Vicinamibacterales bacterium]
MNSATLPCWQSPRKRLALNGLSHVIDVYYLRHGRLPADLAALGKVSDVDLRDPETGVLFEYRPTEPKKYELCAVFSRPVPRGEGASFWWHDAGRQCYGLAPREVTR